MNKRSTKIALLFLASFLAQADALGQSTHTLQGKVALPNGSQPPNSVRVTLTFGGMRVYETFTDLSGRFFFTGLRRGVYQLIAEGDGRTFETTKVNAEIAAYGSAPQSFTQNIQLLPRGGDRTLAAASTSAEAASASIPVRAREEYEKGVKEAHNQNSEKAANHFREAIALYSQFYDAFIGLAEQCAILNRESEAIHAYREAIELKSDRAPAYLGLGMLLVKQKKYIEAIPPLRRSLEIEKLSSMPYLFLGLAEMMTGELQASESNLTRAYEIGRPPLARIYLANLYELKGEPKKSIEQLQSFLRENRNLPQEKEKQIREAIEKLRRQEKRQRN